MGKVAKLVMTSFCSRVVVDENASLEEILAAAKIKLQAVLDNNELGDNLEEVIDDEECPETSLDEQNEPLVQWLPVGWEHPIFNDDYSGLESSEEAFLRAYLEEMYNSGFICASADTETSSWRHVSDARTGYAGNCYEFIFIKNN